MSRFHMVEGLPKAEGDSWLTGAAERHPQATALIYNSVVVSYSALEARVDGLCRLLGQAAVAAGDTLALASRSALLSVMTLHAAQRLGVTLFPLRPHLTPSTLDSVLRQAGVGHLAMEVPGPTTNTAPVVPPFVVTATRSIRKAMSKPAKAGRSEVRLLVTTSGSAGQPKAVMLTQRNLAASVAGVTQVTGLEAGDCWLACLPLFHVGGLAVPLRCAATGARVLLHDRFDPGRVLKDMVAYGVTHVSLVPAMLALLLEENGERPAPPALRVVLTGGGALSPRLAEHAHRAGWPVCVTYGMTETGSAITIDCTKDAGTVPGRVGVSLPGVRVRCESGGSGAPGRIWVSGDGVMAGYVNPRRQPGSGLQDGWFETGDLGFFGADGALHLAGRANDRLVSGGETVHPAEVENMLRLCPGIDEVLVSARRDEVWGDRLVAVYEGSITEREAERRVREYLSGVYRPREFVRVDRLPVENRDKPDRKRLQRWLAASDRAGY